jgi:alpha-galactosidase
MLAAPLIAGNDMNHMSAATGEILTNPGAIAVDQDTLGIEGFKYSAKGGVEIWFKPLAGGDWAMTILNRNQEAKRVAFDWKNKKVTDDLSKRDANFAATTYRLRNLWTNKDAGTTAETLAAEIPGHDVLMLRLGKK